MAESRQLPFSYNFSMFRVGNRSAALLALLLLIAVCSCSRSPAVPDSDSSQKLPFDQEPSTRGSAPTDRLVPSSRVPEGTSLTVRLTGPISSASAHAGDSFEGWLDDPVVVDGQTLLPRGAGVKGRVLDAKASPRAEDAGYLRLALVSIDLHENSVPIVSSSIFTKAAAHAQTPPGDSAEQSSSATSARGPNDVVIAADRRLTFRLARALDLP